MLQPVTLSEQDTVHNAVAESFNALEDDVRKKVSLALTCREKFMLKTLACEGSQTGSVKGTSTESLFETKGLRR